MTCIVAYIQTDRRVHLTIFIDNMTVTQTEETNERNKTDKLTKQDKQTHGETDNGTY